VDSVESIDVYKTPSLAEYGRFTSGVVSVETRVAAKSGTSELNDPLPGVSDSFIAGFQEGSAEYENSRWNHEVPSNAQAMTQPGNGSFEFEVHFSRHDASPRKPRHW